MPYERAGAHTTIEVRGGNKIVKVNEYGTYSLPSRTYFQFRRDRGTVTLAQVNSVRDQISDRIEAVLALDDVTDVDYFQDTSRAGRLQDRMRTFYETEDGLDGFVESDLAHFGPNFTGAQIRKEIAELRASGG